LIFVALLSFLIWIYLLGAHGTFWQAGPVLAPAAPVGAPSVAIVVPARDEEASIAACLRSLLVQDYRGEFRVILVDDASTDRTADIARALAHPRLTIVAAAPRPAGWSGKLWAVAQGIAAADDDTEFYFLTDADITHAPAHLSTLLARAEHRDLDMVSEMVALSCDSWAERALIPAFVFFFQLLYPFARVNDPLSATAAAAGGTILIRRRALTRIGGIAAIRGALIDDVALAKKVKTGGRIWLGHSALAESVRPYAGPADIWAMIARTAYTQLRYSPTLLALTGTALIVVWLVPPMAALFAHGWTQAFATLAWLAAMASYLPTLRRFGRSPAWALALPIIAAFYTAATVASAIAHHRGQGTVWKNRAYGAGA